MPRVTAIGAVTIPEEVPDALGIEPGDEITFEETESGSVLQKAELMTDDGDDPFETYRGPAENDDSLSERMRRLRRTYPRGTTSDGN